MNSNHSFKIAIQEDMLPGPTLEDRFHQAADLGLQGIEFWSQTLPGQAKSIERLSGTGGVVAASINNGHRSRFLDPNPDERERALSELKEAMTLAGRIGASGVVFVPHFFDPVLPDLSPWMDVISVERGLLTAQLEELADCARAEGVQLWVEPVNRYETHLLNRLGDAASLIAGLAHPNLGIVADFFHMALEEPDIPGTILENSTAIGHVHLADSNRRLPGQGTTDFKSALQALIQTRYTGWLAFECGEPGDNIKAAPQYIRDLFVSLQIIRSAIE
jgi:sugar phosphate isomerase/epimerase